MSYRIVAVSTTPHSGSFVTHAHMADGTTMDLSLVWLDPCLSVERTVSLLEESIKMCFGVTRRTILDLGAFGKALFHTAFDKLHEQGYTAIWKALEKSIKK